MSNVPGSGRIDKMSRQWKSLSLIIIGAFGVIGCGIQVVIFPILARPTSATAVQYSLVMVLGIPIGRLLQLSQKET